MSDFKSRLVEEQEQLEERLNKLNEFNQSEKVICLSSIMHLKQNRDIWQDRMNSFGS